MTGHRIGRALSSSWARQVCAWSDALLAEVRLLACSFHHLIAVYRWGWTIRLNADATTTATCPATGRTSHSHAPPQPTAA